MFCENRREFITIVQIGGGLCNMHHWRSMDASAQICLNCNSVMKATNIKTAWKRRRKRTVVQVCRKWIWGALGLCIH